MTRQISRSGPGLDTVLAVCSIFAVAYLLVFPKALTGDFCRVTITKILIKDDGQVMLDFKTVSSSGTAAYFYISIEGKTSPSGGGFGGGFPAWPVEGGGTLEFFLNDIEDLVAGQPLAERTTLEKRILVREGDTHLIHLGEQLALYRFTSHSGRVHEGSISIDRVGGRFW